ncbi:MAG: YEATS-associated helix-containing protein [Bacteroidota bacterium]
MNTSEPSADMTDLALILTIMLLTGLFGGLVNYVMRERGTFQKEKCLRYMITGVAATFLVPLFLNLGESQVFKNLTSGADDRIYEYFTFVGFCLVAAIYSRSFIQSISSKIIKDVNETKEKLDQSIKKSEKVQSLLVDLDDDIEEDELLSTEQTRVLGSLTAQEKKIMHVFASGGRKFRSMDSLHHETSLPMAQVEVALNHLNKKQLLDSLDTKNKIVWFLTHEGRLVARNTKGE